MRVLTWLPQDMREKLESVDPAAGMTVHAGDVADVLGAVSRDEFAMVALAPRRARRVLPLVAAVLLVAVTALGLALIRGDHGSPSRPANGGGSPSSSSPALPPPTFPVDADPRPVVVVDETVDVRGFPDDSTKIAFDDGNIDLATTLPSTPPTRDGYPVLPSARAVRQITDVRSCCVTTSTRLRITSVTLAVHRFQTDRGVRALPAWDIHFANVPDDVFVLAVAASARYPSTLGGNRSAGHLTINGHGRNITLFFIAHHVATDPCDQGYRSTLSVHQWASAVRIVVKIYKLPSPVASSSSPMACATAARSPYQLGGPTPGAFGTRTIRLDAPLGNRIVVNGRNAPYVVTGD